MTDSNRPLMNLTGLNEAVAQFAREREWDQFHSPKNLAMALTNEVGELICHERLGGLLRHYERKAA